MVDQSVQEYLTEYLELHPDVLDSILSKSLNALKVPFFWVNIALIEWPFCSLNSYVTLFVCCGHILEVKPYTHGYCIHYRLLWQQRGQGNW